MGAVIKIILSSPGLLQHLCTLLFLHLLFVLQICYFLILVFNLPVKEKSTQSAVQSTLPISPSAGQLYWGRVEPSSTTTSFAEGHQHQNHSQALPSTVNSAKRTLHFGHYLNVEISDTPPLIIIWYKLLIKRCTCPLVTMWQKSLLCSYTHVHKNHRHLIACFDLGTTISNVRKIGSKGKTNETWLEYRGLPIRSRQSVSRSKTMSFQPQVLLV